MSEKEYKKYDTKAVTHYFNVRLAKDATVKEFGENRLVGLTFVDSSRLDSDEEMWVEANPNKSQHGLASYLEKGDVVCLSGKLTYRRYGDDNSQVAHNLRNAEVVVTPDLIVTLKERGFTPGSDEVKGSAPPPKKKGPGRPKKEEGKKAAKKPIPVDVDLDDDEAEDE